MYLEIQQLSGINWITTTKDIALVILSALAIMTGFLQSRKNRRLEWIKDFRSEIAKLLSLAAALEIDKEEFNKNALQHFSLITLYVDHNDKLHGQLLKEINILLDVRRKMRNNEETSVELSDILVQITKTAKLIMNTEKNKL